MNRRTGMLLASLAAMGLCASCKSSGGGGHPQGERPVIREETIRGTVFYRERVALPRDSLVNVKLVERTRGRDRIIASRMIGPVRRTPIEFELSYDPRQVDEHQDYAIDATILVDRQPWMRCSQPVPCITRGHPRRGIEVLVARDR